MKEKSDSNSNSNWVMKTLDVSGVPNMEFDFPSRSFVYVEDLVRRFLSKNLNQSMWMAEGNTVLVVVDGRWDSVAASATFVLDKFSGKLILRARPPRHGITLEDCAASRDKFAERFMEFLDKNQIEW